MHHLMRDLIDRQTREREQLEAVLEIQDDLITAGCPEWLAATANILPGYRGCGYSHRMRFSDKLERSQMLTISETRLPAEPIQMYQHGGFCPLGGVGDYFTSMVRPTHKVGPVFIEVGDPMTLPILKWFVKTSGNKIVLLSLPIPSHAYPVDKIGERHVVRSMNPPWVMAQERSIIDQCWAYPAKPIKFELVTFPPVGINDPTNYRLHLESATPADAIRELFY